MYYACPQCTKNITILRAFIIRFSKMALLGFWFAQGEIAMTPLGKIFRGRYGFVDGGKDCSSNGSSLDREDATDFFLEDGFGSTRSKVEGSGLGLEGSGSQLVVDPSFVRRFWCPTSAGSHSLWSSPSSWRRSC